MMIFVMRIRLIFISPTKFFSYFTLLLKRFRQNYFPNVESAAATLSTASRHNKLKGFMYVFSSNQRGTWETRNSLKAFVPISKRFDYVCGGVWLGQRSDFRKFCRTARSWTEMDLRRNLQARWFDESYVNAYVARNPECKKLDPSWAWSAKYEQTRDLVGKILLVDKTDVLPVLER
jgi:hypothetical protein